MQDYRPGSVITAVIPPGIQRDDMIGHAQDSLERARDMLRSGSSMTQPREQARVAVRNSQRIACPRRPNSRITALNSDQTRLRWANLLECGERNRRSRDNNALNRSDISRRGRLVPRMVGFANFTIRSTHKFRPFRVARLTRALSCTMKFSLRLFLLTCIALALSLIHI